MSAASGLSPLVRIARVGRPVTGRLALAVLAGACATGAAIGLTTTSAWLISRAAQQPPVLYLEVAIVGVRFFGVSRGVLRYAERLAAHDAAFRVLGHVRSHAYARLEKLAPAGLAEFQSGDLLARLVDDVDGLADLWLRLLIPYLIAGTAAIVTVAGIWLLSPAAAAVLGASLLFVALAVPAVTMAVARRAEAAISEARGELAAETLELLTGAAELRVAGATEDRLRCLAGIDARLASSEARTSAGFGVGALLSGLAGATAVWLGLIAGIVAVRNGSLDGVALAVVVLTPLAVHEPVAALVSAAQHVPGLAGMAARVEEVASRPDPVVEADFPEPLPAGPFGLRTRGLRARYRQAGAPSPAPDGAARPRDALRFPDVDLPAGGRLLVTGPSGSGKSTFAAVLVRFLDARAGTVELTGADRSLDIARLSSADVRRTICLCEQDPHVFDTSVLENVRLARPDSTEVDVRAALDRAQLGSWIESLPDGLDTLVGEHGARLSGGQRQRLALARALLADAPIVVFDEPTEHVDEETATALTADLLEATRDRTVVMITHRPELIAATEWDVRAELGLEPAEAGAT
jgi:thiol reductant ABC exporter CydC subunit